MASENKDKEKDVPLNVLVSRAIQEALERLHMSDRAAPSWSYSVRRALTTGLETLGYPVEQNGTAPKEA